MANSRQEPSVSALYTEEKIQHFNEGFGKLVYADGLLACAQIRARKTYDFNPTVLRGPLGFSDTVDGLKEFEAYLNIIRNNKSLPLRERFVIAGQHWISGDIQIDRDGKVNVLFLDSMGLEYPGTKMHPNTENLLNQFATIFPTANIYFSRTRRQGRGPGCSVFALDDLHHLFTVENYLPSQFATSGLFGYLEDQLNNKPKTSEPYEKWTLNSAAQVHGVPVPLSLMRTTLSSKLYNQYVPDRSMQEVEASVSKRGEKLKAKEAPAYFHQQENIKINKRLEFALAKFKSHITRYLSVTEPIKVEMALSQHTLESFKKKMDISNGIQSQTEGSKNNYYQKLNNALRQYSGGIFRWRSQSSLQLVKTLRSMMKEGAEVDDINVIIQKFLATHFTEIEAKKSKLIGALLDAGIVNPSLLQIEKGSIIKQRKFKYNITTAQILTQLNISPKTQFTTDNTATNLSNPAPVTTTPAATASADKKLDQEEVAAIKRSSP